MGEERIIRFLKEDDSDLNSDRLSFARAVDTCLPRFIIGTDMRNLKIRWSSMYSVSK